MKVLFIGGTGIISSAMLALGGRQGIAALSPATADRPRRARSARSHRSCTGDIRDPGCGRGRRSATCTSTRSSTGSRSRPSTSQQDLALFRGRTGQYVFISSASAYQTPAASLPVTESTPLDNPVWAYSRDKIACEERLLPPTGQTSSRSPSCARRTPTTGRCCRWHGGYTVIDRMRQGKKVVVHGDGTSLWTLTHHEDFAKGFVGLLGNSRAIGDAFHITSDDVADLEPDPPPAGRAAGAQGEAGASALGGHRRATIPSGATACSATRPTA